MTVRCCPPHSCPYGFHNALADAGRWPPPAVPVSAQASLRPRAGFMLPERALATATAALGFMALNIKRRGNKTERVKSPPLIYTVSYKLERMGHGAALSARDPLHSSRPQGRGGCPVTKDSVRGGEGKVPPAPRACPAAAQAACPLPPAPSSPSSRMAFVPSCVSNFQK